MKVQLYRQWTLTRPDGKIRRLPRQKCHSYIIAFADMLSAQMSQIFSAILDTGGISRNIYAHASNFVLTGGGAGVITSGPVVGTGTAAVTLTDNKLQTQIAHGTGAGQLQHGAPTTVAPTTVGTTRKFKIVRVFTNGSTGSITINEVGLYSLGMTWFFCIVRDLQSPGVTIDPATSGTLTYTIGITV